MWSTHPTEYYSASKRKEILTRAITWMSLEDVTLSEIRTNTVSFYLYEVSRRVKLIEIESKVGGGGGYQGPGEKKM